VLHEASRDMAIQKPAPFLDPTASQAMTRYIGNSERIAGCRMRQSDPPASTRRAISVFLLSTTSPAWRAATFSEDEPKRLHDWMRAELRRRGRHHRTTSGIARTIRLHRPPAI